jgi:hypothetical protein
MGRKVALFLAVVGWITCVKFAVAANPLVYDLFDSTISGSGSTQQLTGTFQLISSSSGSGYQTYDVSAMSWSSLSFTVTIDQTAPYTVQTSLSNELAIFGGTVDLTGFSDSKATFGGSSANTLYTGTSSMPTTFTTNPFALISVSTGQQIGEIILNAELVPEPAAITLLAFGATGLLFAGRLFAKRRRISPVVIG